jgi:NADH:ubiquinone oxidoreductase subunit 4 (subunit M)
MNIIIYSLIFLFFITISLFWIFLFFEIILIPIILIVVGWGYQFERFQASSYLLVYTILFSFPFFSSLTILLFETKTLSLVSYNGCLLSSFSIFLLLPFFVKLPIVFVHFWLPKAHVEAPTLGSIILASLLLKLGGYGVIRIKDYVELNITFFFYISIFGMISTLIVCLFQSDTKRLVAYLSVSHINFILRCILLSFFSSKANSIIIIIVHGFSSGIIFFCVGFFFYFVLNRSIYFNHFSFFFFPSLMLWIRIAILSNFRVPPFISVMAEIFFFSIIFSSRNILILGLIIYCVFIAYISLFFLLNFFHGTFSNKKFYSKNFRTFSRGNFFMSFLILRWKIIVFIV